MFRGEYHGKKKHEDDLGSVLERARLAGLQASIITGGSLTDSKAAIKLAQETGQYATVGCHPTRSSEFDEHPGGPEEYLRLLNELVENETKAGKRAVAIGECGLDYDRLKFASQDVQQRYFRLQLSLAKKHHLPLFLHSRAAHTDFVRILREEGFGQDGGRGLGARGGVVHSFTGTAEEARELVDMGFHIGINGCSLKTEQNIHAAASIPLERLLLETDAPWCSMTSTHASKSHLDLLPAHLRTVFLPPASKPENFADGKAVKGRNEPCTIGGVAWVVHRLHDVDFANFTEQVYRNTINLFNLSE